MKHIRGRKPTREERKLLLNNEIDAVKWLIKKHTSAFIELIHIETGEVKIIDL